MLGISAILPNKCIMSGMAYQSHYLIVAMDMFAVLSHNVNKNKKEREIKGNSMK